jgi:hypothetical protein
MIAAFSGLANMVNRCPSMANNGAPGECPTSSLNADKINSLQSHKLAVGSTVDI